MDFGKNFRVSFPVIAVAILIFFLVTPAVKFVIEFIANFHTSRNLILHFLYHLFFVVLLAVGGFFIAGGLRSGEGLLKNYMLLLAILPFFLYYTPDRLQFLYKIKYDQYFIDRHIMFHGFILPLVILFISWGNRPGVLLAGAFALGTGGHCLGDFFSQAAGRGYVTCLGCGWLAASYLLASSAICLWLAIIAAARAHELERSGASVRNVNIKKFALAIITVAYFLAPRDFVPDNVPFTGYLDDLLVATGSYYIAFFSRLKKQADNVLFSSENLRRVQ